MAKIFEGTLSANGTLCIPLINSKDDPGKYTVQLFGDFGGGTAAAFTNGSSTAYTATTNDIVVLNSQGEPVTFIENGAFNVWANSDWQNPNILKVQLITATNPAVTVQVFDGS